MKIKLQAMDEQLITPRTGRKVVTGLLSMHNSSLVEKGRVMIMYDAKYVNDKTPSPGIVTFVKEILTNTKKTFEFISEDGRHFKITFSKINK